MTQLRQFKCKLVLLLVLTFLVAFGRFSYGGQMLPANIGTALILKALTYDRSLQNRFHKEIKVGIFFLSSNKEMAQYAKDWHKSLEAATQQFTINGLKISHDPLEYTGDPADEAAVLKMLKENRISVVLVLVDSPELLETVSHVTKNIRINSFCTSKECLKEGIAFGVSVEGNKPKMYVNLNAVQHEGSDYSGKLLSLCEEVK